MRIPRAKKREAHVAASCALLLGGLLTTACTASIVEPDPTPSVAPHEAWSTEIAAAKERASSPLEVEIFADDDISRSEYESAVSAYVECAETRGVIVTLNQLEDSIYEYSYEVGGIDESGNFDSKVADERLAEGDAILLECSNGTTGLVEAIYAGMMQDPTHG